MTDAELRLLAAGLDTHPGRAADAVRLRLLTGQCQRDRPTRQPTRLRQGQLRKTGRSVILQAVTWGELIRRMKAAGFVEHRTAKGSHRQFIHPVTKQVVTVSVHTKREVGTGLAARILKDAGL